MAMQRHGATHPLFTLVDAIDTKRNREREREREREGSSYCRVWVDVLLSIEKSNGDNTTQKVS
jgi:hypothetical protein